ncbi:MAG: hypothetical protein ABIH25_01900 [Candidatus Woesearchaeota archaeon]
MNKRGQVTIFIILGIVVLIIVGLLFFFRDTIFKGDLDDEEAERFVSARVEPIKNVVRNCVSSKLMEGVRLVSWQGGFYNPVYYENVCVDYDLNSEECFENISIGYACKGDANTLPLLFNVAKQIKLFMNSAEQREDLENCIGSSFVEFEREGLDLDYEFLKLNLDAPDILPKKIRQDVSFPVKISKSGYSTDFRDLSIDLDSNLFDIYMIAIDVVNGECGGEGFEIDDYVWDHEQGGDILAASIANGPNDEGFKPWYLEGYEDEEDGEALRFHFIIEE